MLILVMAPFVHFIHNADGFYSIHVQVRVGSIHEKSGFYGISHFMEHLKFKGSKTMSGDKITDTFTHLGATFNAATSYDRTTYFVCTLIEHAELVTGILLDMIFNTAYDKAQIEKECKVVLEELYMNRDNAKTDPNTEAQKSILASKNPYHRAIVGVEASLKSIRIDDLVEFHKAHYGDFIVVINCPKHNRGQMQRFIEHKLASYRLPPRVTTHSPSHVDALERSVSVHVNDSTQYSSTLTFKGYPRTHPRYYALDFITSILAPGYKTLLFDELRIKRGLVYSVTCDYYAYSDIGFVCITFASSNKQTDDMVRTILRLIAGIKTMRPTRLAKFKDAYINSLNYSLTNPSTMSGFYVDMYDRDPAFKLETLIRQVRSFSKVELGEIVDEILNSKNMGVTTIGQYENSDTMMDALCRLVNNNNQR